MFELILVAKAVGAISRYFAEEASDQDFWRCPIDDTQHLTEDRLWFMVNPEKLKEEFRKGTEILVVTEDEKKGLLRAFALLHKCSKELPENAHLNERLILAKNYLPPVFFDSKPNDGECKIIPFKKPV